MEKENPRLVYADILRVLASFAVILLHVCGNNWISEDINSFNWKVLNIYDSAVRWCVPVFVMLSGMFFLDPQRRVTYKSIFSKSLLRIATAFAAWSVGYAIWSGISASRNGTPQTAHDIFNNIVYGHYHLWFLYMIMGLYLLTPILRKFISAASRRDIEYFLLLYAIFTIISPVLSGMGGLQVFSNVAYRMDLRPLAGYIGYFVIGYYLKAYDFTPKTKKIIYFLGIIGFFATIALTWQASLDWQAPNEKWYAYFAPNVCAMAVAVFLFFKEHITGKRIKHRAMMLINSVSSCSFGIYLAHAFFNSKMVGFGFDAVRFNPIWWTPILALIVMAMSYTLIFLLSKIPLFKKYCM